MSNRVTIKGELVLKYINKFGQNMSKKGLSELIFEKEPLQFSDSEEVRGFIRYYTGQTGDGHRKNKRVSMNYICPSKAKKFPDFILPQKNDNILWLSDIHIPNHDQKAVNVAIEYGLKRKVNTIILGGDILDNEPFSNWEKKPDVNQVKKWFLMTEDFLLMIRMKFPDSTIIWLEGNHDQWYEKWLIKKAPILFEDNYYKLEERLKLNRLGITYLNQYTKMRIDDLYALHGHTLMRQKLPPVNAARGLFLKTKQSCIIGHVHSSSKHVESTLKGKMISCFSVGALCTLSPEYDPHNTKHNQGFAHITRKKGYYHVDNLEIQNGIIYSKLIE